MAEIVAAFTNATGIKVVVQLPSAGAFDNADVVLWRSAGSIADVPVADSMAALPDELIGKVDPRFWDSSGRWVGVSGRAAVIAYNTNRLQPEQLPASLLELGLPQWRAMVGWAPGTDQFRTLIASLIFVEGVEAADRWLKSMRSNRPLVLQREPEVVQAVADGQVAAGLVEHSDVFAARAEAGEIPVAMHWLGQPEAFEPSQPGDAGAVFDVRCAAVAAASGSSQEAVTFIEFLLSPEIQLFLSARTFEYPLLSGVAAHPEVPPLHELQTSNVSLADLASADAVQQLLEAHALTG